MPLRLQIRERRGWRSRRVLIVAVLSTILLVLPNALAWFHARAMTRFVPTGERSASPERLSAFGKMQVLLTGITAQVNPAAVIVECPFDRLITTVENRFSAMGVPSFPFAQLLVFWGGVQQGMNGFAHNPVEYASSVRCPVLLLHGEQDARVSVPQVRSIYENLAGNKELVLFPRAGHESYLADDPEHWKRAVSDFLRRVETTSREEN